MCYRYTDNQRAQDALNLTLFHWGIHGWATYNFVGLAVAFMCHRLGELCFLFLLVCSTRSVFEAGIAVFG